MPFQRHILSCVFALALIGHATAQDITVRPGDTLWGLARSHKITVDELRRANNLVGDALSPGMALSLPGSVDAGHVEYLVKAGDTLHEIAIAFGLSTDTLIAYNDLEGTLIKPGQVLSLVPPDTGLNPLVVSVRPGDTLWGIARQHDVTVAALTTANAITASAVLRPGASLIVPGRYAGGLEDQGGAVAPTVVVAPGESLSVLARRHGTTVSALIAANELPDTTIRAGQRLRVVPGSQVVRAAPRSAPAPGAGAMLWPLHGEITSRFGYRRLRIGGTNMHYGLDIDGDSGDPIRAAVPGVVTFSGWQGGYGNLVIVESGETEYYYAHASALLVRVGDTIQAGQVLAKVGATGNTTGSHLHFEIRVDGTPVDPLPILQAQAQAER
jgi:murein DD-endopeptidase MepM/ murein hydrolase activator NlpD